MFPRRSSDDGGGVPFCGRESSVGPPPTVSSRPSIRDCVSEANRQSHSSFTRDFFTTRPPSVLDELGSTSTADHFMDKSGGGGGGGDGSSGVPVVVGDERYANDSFRSRLSAGTRSTTSHFRYEDRILENIDNNNNNNNNNNDDDDDDGDSIGDKELEDEDDAEQGPVPPYSESTLDYTSTSSPPPSPPPPPPSYRPSNNACTTRQRWNRDANDEDDAEGGPGDGGVEVERMEDESDGDDGASPWSNWKKMLKLKTHELGGSNGSGSGSGSGSGVGVGNAGGSKSVGGGSTRKKNAATHSSVISPRENEVDRRGRGGGGGNVMIDIESACERRGECPGCGQRCFSLDEMGGGMNGDGINNAEKRPLTIPGRVLNGDCLHCNPWLADVEREVRTSQQQQTWNQDSVRRERREQEEYEEDKIKNRSTTVSSRSKPGAVAVSSPPDAIEKDEDGRSSSSYIADDNDVNGDDEHVAPPTTRTTRRSPSGNGDSMDQRAQRRLRDLLDVLTVHNIPSCGGGGDALSYNDSNRQGSGRLHESFTEGMGDQYHRNHAQQGGGGWGGEAGNAAFVDPLRYRRRNSLTDGTVSSTTSSLSPRSPIGRSLGSRAHGSVGPKPREGRPTPAPGPVEPDHPGPHVSRRFLMQEKTRSKGRKNRQLQQQMKCVPELCPGTVIVPNTVDDENGAAEIVLPIDEHIVLCKECRTKLCVKKFATLVSCPECETVSAASSTRR